MKRRWVEVEHRGVRWTVEAIVDRDPLVRPDAWWSEGRIHTDSDIGRALRGWTTEDYEELMERVEGALREMMGV